MAIRAKRKATRPDEFLHGIPNADLSDEDYEALSTEDRQRVRESPLFDVKTEREAASETSHSSSSTPAKAREGGD